MGYEGDWQKNNFHRQSFAITADNATERRTAPWAASAEPRSKPAKERTLTMETL
jgi:hypothetical protein